MVRDTESNVLCAAVTVDAFVALQTIVEQVADGSTLPLDYAGWRLTAGFDKESCMVRAHLTKLNHAGSREGTRAISYDKERGIYIARHRAFGHVIQRLLTRMPGTPMAVESTTVSFAGSGSMSELADWDADKPHAEYGYTEKLLRAQLCIDASALQEPVSVGLRASFRYVHRLFLCMQLKDAFAVQDGQLVGVVTKATLIRLTLRSLSSKREKN